MSSWADVLMFTKQAEAGKSVNMFAGPLKDGAAVVFLEDQDCVKQIGKCTFWKLSLKFYTILTFTQ